MDAEQVGEVEEDDGLPYRDPTWEIPCDTPEELAAECAAASLEAHKRLDDEDPWY